MTYELKHRTAKALAKGTPYPLGATLTRDGVNFAVYSKHAAEVFLLLFDQPDGEPTDIIKLPNRDKRLGINAVEFLPVHEYYVDDFLVQKGLTNYWGYNSIGFFAPESSYSTQRTPGCQVSEFKTLVRELHKEGIQVILDVVYNHTGEGSEMGPTVCFRGLDNLSYYTLTVRGMRRDVIT